MNLLGYTSTSKDICKAKSFAFSNCNGDKVPIVLEITFKGCSGLFELTKGYSAYADEEEVLIQDGLSYRVLENKTMFDEAK